MKTVLIGVMVGKAKPSKDFEYAKHLSVDLLVFSPKGVKWTKKNIQGYQYKNGVWKWKTCPFPEAIYNRLYLSTRTMVNKLEGVIGKGKVFNCITHFDKWEIHNILRDSVIRQYVPETHAYHPDKFISLLSQYKTLILKPSKGQLGRNIYLVEKTDKNEYKLYDNLYPKKMKKTSQQPGSDRFNQSTENERNNRLISEEDLKKAIDLINDDKLEAKIYATDKETFVKKVNTLVNKQKFIVQQFICLDRIDQRIYDIRLYAQKNHQGKWTVSGGFSRVGNPDSYINNFITEIIGIAGTLEANNLMTTERLDKMNSISLRAAHLIERKIGHLGEMSVDFCLDQHGKIWIIEVNGRTQKKFVKRVNNKKLTATIYSKPIEYARYLAKK
jgi:hypothetical protein